MRKESDVEKIIRNAPLAMQEMLRLVYRYCSSLLLMEQEKLFERVLFAFSVVDRKFFVDENPYMDTALHIGKGQTISQPSTVAAMILHTNIQEGDNILEIGSGSGWNAALLSYLAYPSKVVSLERFLSLSEKAKKNVNALKKHLSRSQPQESIRIRPTFIADDIFQKRRSWKKKYNKILFTAGIVSGQEKNIEEVAEDLLLEGGILVCPQVAGPIIMFKKQGKLYRRETKEEYLFVPLKEGIEA